jgi:arabinose-5-phosphate isomerase
MSLDIARKVLEIEADAVRGLIVTLDERFLKAVDLVYGCTGRTILTGMGKSGIICKKISATLASTGTPSLFLHPAEAVHGDLGMVVEGDVVVAVSNSGETTEITRMLDRIKRLRVPLISLVGSLQSTLARYSDVALHIPIPREADPLGLAPTASTTAALAMGDALAVALTQRRGFRREDFAAFHPGGELGRQLLKVEDLMHRGERVPLVGPETTLKDCLIEMSAKGFGMTTVAGADGTLLGIVTDGDLRRALEQDVDIKAVTAAQCMTTNPATIPATALATRALALMEDRKITCLCIVDGQGGLEGIVHLHDLWRTEMV